jgi:hypothetical protein
MTHMPVFGRFLTDVGPVTVYERGDRDFLAVHDNGEEIMAGDLDDLDCSLRLKERLPPKP